MSMKKDELCKLKIDIQTNNLFRYREIAVLVDKPKFLEEVKKIREIIGIGTLLPFRAKHWQIDSMKWSTNNQKGEQVLTSETERLCNTFERPKHMVNDIYQAILFGKIYDKDPAVGIVYPKTYLERPYVAIFPTLSTTDKAILIALKEAKRILKGNSILSSSFDFKAHGLEKIAPHQIKEHRELYWRNLAGESYTDIALTICDEDERMDYEKRKANNLRPEKDIISTRPAVAQAIQRYKEALKTA